MKSASTWTATACCLDGRDVTKEIRTFEITTSIQYAADNPAVRDQLVAWQRAAADGRDVVTEGRDQGTVVFPNAECKIFLTADEDERARRRYRDLVARGENVTFDEVLGAQHVRDERDRTRPVGALLIADDAIEVSTNGLSPAEVVARLETHRPLQTMTRRTSASSKDSPTGKGAAARGWYAMCWCVCWALCKVLFRFHYTGRAQRSRQRPAAWS